MRRVCVSLTSAIKDFHKVAAFIGRAVQWVWGEFRHRAAGFDAQQSVSTLLRQATRLWCIYVKCGKVAKCLDQLKIKKNSTERHRRSYFGLQYLYYYILCLAEDSQDN